MATVATDIMPWSSSHDTRSPAGEALPPEDVSASPLDYKPIDYKAVDYKPMEYKSIDYSKPSIQPPIVPRGHHHPNGPLSGRYPQSPGSAPTRALPSPGTGGSGSTIPTACMKPTWKGFIHTTRDGLMLLEACLQGQLIHIPRRPHDRERQSIISSGNIFIYEENASGIRRWTDGITWSPSRIMGNFLVYRELRDGHQPGEKKRAVKKRKRSSEDVSSAAASENNPKSEEDRMLIGSLSLDAYNFKPGGLAKKTLSVELRGVRHHIISYYRVEDVKSGLYHRPCEDEFLRGIVPRQELTENPGFKFPVEDRDDKPSNAVVSPRGAGHLQPNHHLQMVNAGLPVVVNVPHSQPAHIPTPRSMPQSAPPVLYHSQQQSSRRSSAGYPLSNGLSPLDPYGLDMPSLQGPNDHVLRRPSQTKSSLHRITTDSALDHPAESKRQRVESPMSGQQSNPGVMYWDPTQHVSPNTNTLTWEAMQTFPASAKYEEPYGHSHVPGSPHGEHLFDGGFHHSSGGSHAHHGHAHHGSNQQHNSHGHGHSQGHSSHSQGTSHSHSHGSHVGVSSQGSGHQHSHTQPLYMVPGGQGGYRG